MNTQISTKLAALGVALIMNSVLIGSVAFLFNGQVRPAITLNSTHTYSSTHAAVSARM